MTEPLSQSMDSFFFQNRVYRWMKKWLGMESATEAQLRDLRFLEEAVELVQARGLPFDKVKEVVILVYGRPPGEPSQEVGGVVITLSALCSQAGIIFSEEAYRELVRIEAPNVGEAIRARQSSKPNPVAIERVPYDNSGGRD